jgi:hypothetical protein
MIKIACPGCKKQYKLAPSAAGQVANCKCGTRFRVGSASAGKESSRTVAEQTNPRAGAAPTTVKPTAASPSQQAAPRAVARPAVPAKPPASKAAGQPSSALASDDAFWSALDDNSIPELDVAASEPRSASPATRLTAASSGIASPQQKLVSKAGIFRVLKLLAGPPLALFGVLVVWDKVSKGERLPRGAIILVFLGIGLTIGGITGK